MLTATVTPRRRYTFFIDEDLDAGLNVLKERDGTPESEAIRRAVREYLERRGVRVGLQKAERKRVATRKRP